MPNNEASNPPSDQVIEFEKLLTSILRVLFRPKPDDPLADLTQAQIRMLRALEAGAESASSVGDHLCLSVSAVTQVANRLEAIGLVKRTEGATDKRVKPLALTDRGRELLEFRNRYRIDRVDTALRGVSAEEQQEILLALQRLKVALLNEKSALCGKELDSSSTEEGSTELLTGIASRLVERSPQP